MGDLSLSWFKTLGSNSGKSVNDVTFKNSYVTILSCNATTFVSL
jgi:hypothetical protein